MSIGFTSCQKDDSLDPRAQLVPGQYARLDITSKLLNVDDTSNSYFGGLLTNPSNKIISYKLYVKYRDAYGTLSTNKLIKTVNSFPFDLKIYINDIASTFGLPVSSFTKGYIYYFYAESFDSNGYRTDYYSLSSTVQSNPTMKNGYRFNTASVDNLYISNPLNVDNYDNYVNP